MPKSSRRHARIIAFQIIYQRQKIGIQATGESFLMNQFSLSKSHQDFVTELTTTTWKELAAIDEQIKSHLLGWRQERISDSLNALLRIAICELLYFETTDGKIVLNEAIEICRSYVDKDATKILNGVLHAVWTDFTKADLTS